MNKLLRQKEVGLKIPQKSLDHTHEVWFECGHIDHVLSFHFLVKKKKPHFFCFTESFSKNDYRKNWGLWNNDVVEVFVQNRKDVSDQRSPYWEIQVSPLNQPFGLYIEKPREIFNIPETLNLKTQTKLFEDDFHYLWESQLHLELPIADQEIFLGAFACLGFENEREYFSLNPNTEEKPDFHRPELFLPLNKIGN